MSLLGLLANIYLDINVLLAVALAAWLATSLATTMQGHPASPTRQQYLLRLGIASALAAPVALYVLAFAPAFNVSEIQSLISPADYLIAQYASGRLALDASEVESLVGIRQSLHNGFWPLDGRIGDVVVVSFAAGAGVCAISFIRNLVRLHRTLDRCHPWRRAGNVHVVVSDTASVPFAARTLRGHHIVIPSGMLVDRDDLRLAIAHEAQHLRNGDAAWEIFLEALKPLFFWNPAFLIWKARSERLRELACDRAVLHRRQFGVEQYCGFLLSASRRGAHGATRAFPATPAVAIAPVGRWFFGRRAERILQQRVLSLVDLTANGNQSRRSGASGGLLVAIVAMAAIWIQPPATVSTDRLHLSTMVNLEAMASNRTERGYGLVMAY